MSIVVVAVGRIRERPFRELLDDYAKRIERFTHLEEYEVKDDVGLERHFERYDRRIALQVTGKAFTSVKFSTALTSWLERGAKRTAFFIGGAEGLPAAVERGAEFSLSLSTFTLPHRLARLVLFEQLYRALSLARGEPYAREQ